MKVQILSMFVLFAFVHVIKADSVREVWIRTENCNGCGMSLGSGNLDFKICGQADPATQVPCCIGLRAVQTISDGGAVIIAGDDLGECLNFDLGALPDTIGDELVMVAYHSGSDDIFLESMTVFTENGNYYDCEFNELLQGQSYEQGSSCSVR